VQRGTLQPPVNHRISRFKVNWICTCTAKGKDRKKVGEMNTPAVSQIPGP